MMKKITLIIFSVLFFTGMSFISNAQLPIDWEGDTGIQTFKESVVVHEGSFSCGVDVTTGNQAECDLSSTVEIPVNTGDTYKISFWYFTSEHVRIRTAMDWNAGSPTYSTNYGGPTSTGDWEQFTFEGTVPDDVTKVFLRLRFYDYGSFVAPETQYVDLVEFESPVGTPLPVSNGGFEQWPSLNPEPSNYPTGFTAVANNLTIQLNWTDAVGGQLPSAYLIKASDEDNIQSPEDGIFEIDDFDLADGEGAANVSFGIETFSFSGLVAQTTYYFKIFPYTNSGPNVDYKTDGTPPFAEATTAYVVTLNQEDFNEGWGEWTTISVIGDQVWDRNNNYGINGTPCAKMSGYESGSFENEDWLISPVLDFTQNDNEVFSFYSAMGYPTGTPQLTVKISTDYDGVSDPNTATWDDLNPILASGNPYFEWTFSGSLNVSAYESDNVYLAFKYVSTNTESETWEIDDILVTAGGGSTPIITVLSPTAGSIWIRGNSYDIQWSAINTQSNVTIEVTENASSGNPTWTQLGTELASAGSWTWDIPAGQNIGNDYKIRISDFASETTGESGIFSISDPSTIYDIVINEIMYNPPSSLGVDDYWEYLEIYNNEDEAVDLSGWYFSNGFEFIFDAGTVIDSGAYLVIARNPDTIANFYGITNLVGPFNGALNNGGETVAISDALGTEIDAVSYEDSEPWPTEPDGNGPSLSLINPDLNNSLPESWLPSLEDFGTPGIVNFPAEPVIIVVFPNGGEYLQQGENYDITWSYMNFTGFVKIELINLAGGNEVLAPSVDVSEQSWTWSIPIDQTLGSQFKIKISNVDGGDPWDESDEVFSIIEPVEVPDLVITEIMYNPPESGTDSLEFIEFFNNDTEAIDLTDYYFSNGVDFIFPSFSLNPGEFLLVAKSSVAMQNTFGVEALQWTDGALSNGGELIEIKDNFGNVVDFVYYDDELPWDTLADGYGPSLTFCDPDLDNSLPENWIASVEFAAVNAAGDTIWATPGAGCASPEPVADFIADNTSIQVGETVTFTDLSTGDPTSWEWTFEGGEPATYSGQNPPPVTYNSVGNFDVSLTVTNETGSSTETKIDYIEVYENPPPPAADFIADQTTINEGGAVNFTDLSTNDPTSWIWTFEGGSPATSTEQHPSNIIYDTPGTYDVTLTVTNDYGSDTEIKTDYITVLEIPPPQADFTADQTVIYVDESVLFTDLSTGDPTSWSWTFESGNPSTSNQQGPVEVIYNTAGTFDVSLTVSNQYGSTTETKTDYITVLEPSDYNLVITEIMYNPPESGDDILEFIEIYNNGNQSANLNGLYFSQGIVFDFPAENLPVDNYFLVAKDADAFNTAFGVTAHQWTGGGLNNGGETIEIKDAAGNTIDIVDYDNNSPWPLEPDGNGPSLTLCDPDIDNNLGENWFSSINFAGLNPDGDSLFATPGGPCMINKIDESATFTEIKIFPNPSNGIFTLLLPETENFDIEIFNPTGKKIFSGTGFGTSEIHLLDQPKGVYILKINNSSKTFLKTKKLFIQ